MSAALHVPRAHATQHGVENPLVTVVLYVHVRVESRDRLEADLLTVFAACDHPQALTGSEAVRNSEDVVGLAAGQPELFGSVSLFEL